MIEAKIIRSKRRTITLEISPTREVIVRCPEQTKEKQIQQLVEKHQEWINKKIGNVIAIPPRQFVLGEEFLYLGQSYPLYLVDASLPIILGEKIMKPSLRSPLVFANAFYYFEPRIGDAKDQFKKWYKKEALVLFQERCAHWASLSNVNYSVIKLSSADKRWGSCNSRTATINLNWHLIMAPLSIIDYVVVHELMHLKEANHSKKFWDHVRIFVPDYAQKRNWLKNNSHQLIWYAT